MNMLKFLRVVQSASQLIQSDSKYNMWTRISLSSFGSWDMSTEDLGCTDKLHTKIEGCDLEFIPRFWPLPNVENHPHRGKKRKLFKIFCTHFCSLSNMQGLGAGGEGDDRGWDGWMASPTRWTWVWIHSGSWWWTGRPGMLRFMGSQRVGRDWTELNWLFIRHYGKAHQEMPGSLWCLCLDTWNLSTDPWADGSFLQAWWQNIGYGKKGKLEDVKLKAKMLARALVSGVYCQASRFIAVQGLRFYLYVGGEKKTRPLAGPILLPPVSSVFSEDFKLFLCCPEP